MAVNDSGTQNQYTATGGQTVFAYTFEIFDSGDIVVQQNSTVLSEGTHYTVSNVGNDSGGNVTFVTGAVAGDVITLYRDMALERLNDYQQNGDFLASEVNDDFDRLWLAIQQEATGNSLAIRAPIDDPILNATNTKLTTVTLRANKSLGFSSTGTLDYISGSMPVGTLRRYSTLSAAVSDVGNVSIGDELLLAERTTGNGGGATWRAVDSSTVTENGYEIVTASASISYVLDIGTAANILEFGAIPDGDGAGAGTDNSGAIQAAANARGRVIIPMQGAGIYRHDTQLNFVNVNAIEIIADKGVVLDATNVSTQFSLWVSGEAYPTGGTADLSDRTVRTGGVALGADVSKGVINELTIPSSLGLVRGDIIRLSSSVILYPENGASYRGELAEVLSVSGTTVNLTTTLNDSYTAATTTVFKLKAPKCTIQNIKVIRNLSERCLSVWECRDVDISNCEVVGARDVAFEFAYLYGGEIHRLRAKDTWNSSGGSRYGISIISSQSLEIHGNNIHGGRHAFTSGGFEPSRFLDIHSNTFATRRNEGSGAFDWHTNTQYCKAHDNSIIGGANFSGSDNSFYNNEIQQHASTASGGGSGIVAYYERDSQYTRICNNTIISYGDGSTTSGLGGESFIFIQPQGPNLNLNEVTIEGNKCTGLIGFTQGGVYVAPLFSTTTGTVIDRLYIRDNDIDVLSGSGSATKAIAIDDNTHGAGALIKINECYISGGRYKNVDGRAVEITTTSTSGCLEMNNTTIVYGTGCFFTLATNNFAELRMRNSRVKRTSGGTGQMDIFGHNHVEVTNNTFENMTGATMVDIRNATNVYEGNHRRINATGGVFVTSPTKHVVQTEYEGFTTALLTSLTAAVNTDASKVEGYKVKNTSTGLYVVAAGNADNSVWVYEGTGTTAHTPV